MPVGFEVAGIGEDGCEETPENHEGEEMIDEDVGCEGGRSEEDEEFVDEDVVVEEEEEEHEDEGAGTELGAGGLPTLHLLL